MSTQKEQTTKNRPTKEAVIKTDNSVVWRNLVTGCGLVALAVCNWCKGHTFGFLAVHCDFNLACGAFHVAVKAAVGGVAFADSGSVVFHDHTLLFPL